MEFMQPETENGTELANYLSNWTICSPFELFLPNFAPFLPAAEQVYTLALFRVQPTNSLFGQHWKHWFLTLINVVWHMWPNVTSVTTSDKYDYMDIWTFGHHGHLDIMDIWTSWTFGHHGYLDIMDIWNSWIFGHHGHLDMRTWFQMCKILHINIWNIAGHRYLRTFPSCFSLLC